MNSTIIPLPFGGETPCGKYKGGIFFSGVKTTRFLKFAPSSGQGSLEYLLLIGGAVLVVVVVLLVLTTSVIPAGEQFLQNRLNNLPSTIPGGNTGTNPPAPPAYSGPLLMNWSNVARWEYASFAFNHQVDPFTADPPKTISPILLSNTGAAPLSITHVRPSFAMNTRINPSSSSFFPSPAKISSLDVFLDDVSNTFLFSLTDLDSDVTYALSAAQTLDPSLGWRIVARFDQPILPVEESFFLFPAEHDFSFSVAWTDASGVVHTPSEWNSALVYEKGRAAGAIDPRISVCDGDSSVGSTQGSTVNVITDWCVPSSPDACAYTRDLGYSTVFSLPTPLSLNAVVLDTRLFMTQLDTVSQGEAVFSDADPYAFIKTPTFCDGLIFDNVEDTSPSHPGLIGTSSPQDGDDEDNDVKWFDVDSLFSPGEGEVSVSIVGADSPGYPSLDIVSEGMRQWETGYSSGNATPAPFILIRYNEPI